MASASVGTVAPGTRLRLLDMPDDPDPLPAGETGVVVAVRPLGEFDQILVAWESGRALSLVTPPDRFEVLED